ncbi:DUF368 domain-containing protein [Actinoalloteichus caeruleus]|uniref:DUF368 domain-containing protein n=1 Tax=Actinoalloteichus cyanogriseus TaxID=2893586 RepID=UPI003BB87B4E
MSAHSWKQTPLNLARGAAIGTVEVVPGVSGGTVALVVGVYERLIDAAGHLMSAVKLAASDLPRGRGGQRAKEEAARIDVPLVVGILAGMVLALLTAARVVPGLIEDYPVGARALFIGMVGASVAIPILAMGGIRRPLDWALLPLGIAVGWIVTGLPAGTQTSPPLWLVGLAAAIAICGLVMPGLSGAFLLMIFGLYEPTLEALNARDLPYVGTFMLGAILGLGVFVKTLQYLLKHRHQATLAVMTGIMIGALRALWPWQDEDRAMLAPDADWLGVVPVTLLGAGMVVALILVDRHFTKKRREREGSTPDGGPDGGNPEDAETVVMNRVTDDTIRIR